MMSNHHEKTEDQLDFPTRSDAGKVYAYERRILQGFGVGISTYIAKRLGGEDVNIKLLEELTNECI
jgi:hypothetical protein